METRIKLLPVAVESVLFFHSRLEAASMKRNSRNIFRDSSTALGGKG